MVRFKSQFFSEEMDLLKVGLTTLIEIYRHQLVDAPEIGGSLRLREGCRETAVNRL